MTKTKVKMAAWLAKQNGISQELIGQVEAETEKALLFSGHAFTEERINCMRCGRELTHPSSRLVGFGPTCCKHIGIDWPNKDELSESEINHIKAKIHDINWQGWLPKSQIEIGDYEVKKKKKEPLAKIGLNARKLKTTGKIKIKGIALYSRYEDRHKCRKIKEKFGGKWNSKKKRWHYPLQTKVVDYAKRIWKTDGMKLEVSDMLQDWYNEEVEKKQKAIKTKQEDDVKPDKFDTILSDTLYDFQRVGTSFLTNSNGAILADDMGLGKTIQSLATVDEIGAKDILIVCPATLKSNWKNEIKKWLPEAISVVLKGSKKKRLEQLKKDSQFIITNYASIREKSRKKVNGDWTKITNPLFKALNKKWDVIILDEAHRAKNRKSQQTKALYKITKNCKKVFELTGTPIMNKPEEIWSLLHILDPIKYSSYWRFVRQYCEVYNNGWGMEIGEATNPKEFREMLDPIMLRRMKEEVIEDMPELIIQKQQVELEGKQRKIYEKMEKDMIVELSEQEEVAAPIIIAQLTRLKQIAVSPELLSDNPSVKNFKKSAKIKALMDILDGAGEQKVVIFSQFKKAINLLAKVFNEQIIEYGMITGDVKQDLRQAEVDRFQNNPDCKVFLATIKTAGVGINLTAGSISTFLDKDWTPAINSQAVDRLHRIGQEKNVTVKELIAKNTVEEYIEKLLESKQETFDTLIESKINGKEILMNLKGRG